MGDLVEQGWELRVERRLAAGQRSVPRAQPQAVIQRCAEALERQVERCFPGVAQAVVAVQLTPIGQMEPDATGQGNTDSVPDAPPGPGG